MATKYFAGKWNDHDIVVVSGENEELRFDGEIITKNKSGIRFSVDMKGQIPIAPELTALIHLSEGNCTCIVGKALETQYDKETKTFSAEYNGHTIEGNNKKFKGTLIIDGEEVDKEDSGLRDFGILGAKLDADSKRIMAVFSSSGLKVICEFFAEAENVRMIPCQRQGGELIPISSNVDDQFAAGFVLGMCVN